MIAQVVGRGSFAGASGHMMSGAFTIETAVGANELVIADGFRFDGAPAPWWAFGRAGSFDRDTLFAKLERLAGAQRAAIPPTIPAEEFDTVILWCRAADVLLGSGAIEWRA